MAGFRALARSGARALRAEALARDLDTTKGSFYWHFKDLPDYLTRLGVPFREAHHVTGTLVALAEKKGCDLPELQLAEMNAFFATDTGSATRHDADRCCRCHDALFRAT